MKVPFDALRMHFPDTDSVSPDELYQWIGYPENIGNINFRNTCAIRMSVALLGAGFPNPGDWPIKAGKYKGRAIETKQLKLSNWLIRNLGAPEKFKSGSDAEKMIGSRRGIVSFFHLDGPSDPMGHISIVAKNNWYVFRCGSERDDRPTGCYWGASEVWFWPLP